MRCKRLNLEVCHINYCYQYKIIIDGTTIKSFGLIGKGVIFFLRFTPEPV